MKRRTLIAVVALILITSFARVLAADRQIREHDPNWVAPPDAVAKLNPLADRLETAAGGQKVFKQRCSACHGEDARGGSDAPDLTQPAVQVQADGALFWKISSGNTRAGMPSFSFIPEPQRWQLVLHLRTLSQEALRVGMSRCTPTSWTVPQSTGGAITVSRTSARYEPSFTPGTRRC